MQVFRLSLLSASLLTVSSMAKTTTVGLETAEGSRSMKAEINECYSIDEDEVFTVAVSQKCRFFVHEDCVGPNIVLDAGEHPSKDPVPVGSFVCYTGL
ncbi:hypothetical protein FE257_002485 [Aspergillus nanangensis]|uniref:Uncharacterized protein n=1 Tax=Aspergillus nanangensis TaxID=2582783 RepID=A0AAD4GVU9_ASPNN|nr:hypothetical protein FE257_002485 [Aspergillus nanangensis]